MRLLASLFHVKSFSDTIVLLGTVGGRNTVESIEHTLQMNTLNFRKWERAKGQNQKYRNLEGSDQQM